MKMKLYDLNQIRKQKDNAAQVITLENIKQFSKDDLLEHLQTSIDCLVQEQLYSETWHFWRNHIDDLVEIIEIRMD